MNLPTAIAIKTITFYQSELSHKKKYRCAHSALNKGLSCSEYSKQQIAKAGLLKGLTRTLSRFKECYQAKIKIKALNSEGLLGDKSHPQKTDTNDKKIDPCTIAYVGTEAACCIFGNWT